MTIKEEVIAAGRYKEINLIITDLIQSTEYDFPLHHPYRDRNITDPDENFYIWRLLGDVVRKEALRFYQNLSDNIIDSDDFEEYGTLYDYIDNELTILMNNYTVHCAHRKQPSEEDLETIRVHLIIKNLLINLNDKDDENPWTIPDGWKKQS